MIPSLALKRTAIKIGGARNSTVEVVRGRLMVVLACFALLFFVVAVRAVDMMVVGGGAYSFEYAQKAQAQAGHEFVRGRFYDRHNQLVATTLQTASLFADPRLVFDKKKAAQSLAQIFPDMDTKAFEDAMNAKGRFAWLRRNITPAEQKQVLRIGEPGLGFRYEGRRIYPQGELAAHLLGYTNVDNKVYRLSVLWDDL